MSAPPLACQSLRTDVAALYVDPRGPYPSLVAEWYDEARDARTYAGPWPVVAHPPCRNWSSLKHLAGSDDSDCGVVAFEQVRRWGGVLEQPARSALFAHVGAPVPGELPDAFGGITIEVNQCDFGHVARKATWLYLCGVRELGVLPSRREPTHWCSGGRTPSSRHGSPVPPGIKVCSAQQRRRTPIAFAEWLLDLAAQCGRGT